MQYFKNDKDKQSQASSAAMPPASGGSGGRAGAQQQQTSTVVGVSLGGGLSSKEELKLKKQEAKASASRKKQWDKFQRDVHKIVSEIDRVLPGDQAYTTLHDLMKKFQGCVVSYTKEQFGEMPEKQLVLRAFQKCLVDCNSMGVHRQSINTLRAIFTALGPSATSSLPYFLTPLFVAMPQVAFATIPEINEFIWEHLLPLGTVALQPIIDSFLAALLPLSEDTTGNGKEALKILDALRLRLEESLRAELESINPSLVPPQMPDAVAAGADSNDKKNTATARSSTTSMNRIRTPPPPGSSAPPGPAASGNPSAASVTSPNTSFNSAGVPTELAIKMTSETIRRLAGPHVLYRALWGIVRSVPSIRPQAILYLTSRLPKPLTFQETLAEISRINNNKDSSIGRINNDGSMSTAQAQKQKNNNESGAVRADFDRRQIRRDTAVSTDPVLMQKLGCDPAHVLAALTTAAQEKYEQPVNRLLELLTSSFPLHDRRIFTYEQKVELLMAVLPLATVNRNSTLTRFFRWIYGGAELTDAVPYYRMVSHRYVLEALLRMVENYTIDSRKAMRIATAQVVAIEKTVPVVPLRNSIADVFAITSALLQREEASETFHAIIPDFVKVAADLCLREPHQAAEAVMKSLFEVVPYHMFLQSAVELLDNFFEHHSNIFDFDSDTGDTSSSTNPTNAATTSHHHHQSIDIDAISYTIHGVLQNVSLLISVVAVHMQDHPPRPHWLSTAASFDDAVLGIHTRAPTDEDFFTAVNIFARVRSILTRLEPILALSSSVSQPQEDILVRHIASVLRKIFEGLILPLRVVPPAQAHGSNGNNATTTASAAGEPVVNADAASSMSDALPQKPPSSPGLTARYSLGIHSSFGAGGASMPQKMCFVDILQETCGAFLTVARYVNVSTSFSSPSASTAAATGGGGGYDDAAGTPGGLSSFPTASSAASGGGGELAPTPSAFSKARGSEVLFEYASLLKQVMDQLRRQKLLSLEKYLQTSTSSSNGRLLSPTNSTLLPTVSSSAASGQGGQGGDSLDASVSGTGAGAGGGRLSVDSTTDLLCSQQQIKQAKNSLAACADVLSQTVPFMVGAIDTDETSGGIVNEMIKAYLAITSTARRYLRRSSSSSSSATSSPRVSGSGSSFPTVLSVQDYSRRAETAKTKLEAKIAALSETTPKVSKSAASEEAKTTQRKKKTVIKKRIVTRRRRRRMRTEEETIDSDDDARLKNVDPALLQAISGYTNKPTSFANNNSVSAADTTSPTKQDPQDPVKVEHLVDALGCTRDEASTALEAAGGVQAQAANLIMNGAVQPPPPRPSSQEPTPFASTSGNESSLSVVGDDGSGSGVVVDVTTGHAGVVDNQSLSFGVDTSATYAAGAAAAVDIVDDTDVNDDVVDAVDASATAACEDDDDDDEFEEYEEEYEDKVTDSDDDDEDADMFESDDDGDDENESAAADAAGAASSAGDTASGCEEKEGQQEHDTIARRCDFSAEDLNEFDIAVAIRCWNLLSDNFALHPDAARNLLALCDLSKKVEAQVSLLMCAHDMVNSLRYQAFFRISADTRDVEALRRFPEALLAMLANGRTSGGGSGSGGLEGCRMSLGNTTSPTAPSQVPIPYSFPRQNSSTSSVDHPDGGGVVAPKKRVTLALCHTTAAASSSSFSTSSSTTEFSTPALPGSSSTGMAGGWINLERENHEMICNAFLQRNSGSIDLMISVILRSLLCPPQAVKTRTLTATKSVAPAAIADDGESEEADDDDADNDDECEDDDNDASMKDGGRSSQDQEMIDERHNQQMMRRRERLQLLAQFPPHKRLLASPTTSSNLAARRFEFLAIISCLMRALPETLAATLLDFKQHPSSIASALAPWMEFPRERSLFESLANDLLAIAVRDIKLNKNSSYHDGGITSPSLLPSASSNASSTDAGGGDGGGMGSAAGSLDSDGMFTLRSRQWLTAPMRSTADAPTDCPPLCLVALQTWCHFIKKGIVQFRNSSSYDDSASEAFERYLLFSLESAARFLMHFVRTSCPTPQSMLLDLIQHILQWIDRESRRRKSSQDNSNSKAATATTTVVGSGSKKDLKPAATSTTATSGPSPNIMNSRFNNEKLNVWSRARALYEIISLVTNGMFFAAAAEVSPTLSGFGLLMPWSLLARALIPLARSQLPVLVEKMMSTHEILLHTLSDQSLHPISPITAHALEMLIENVSILFRVVFGVPENMVSKQEKYVVKGLLIGQRIPQSMNSVWREAVTNIRRSLKAYTAGLLQVVTQQNLYFSGNLTSSGAPVPASPRLFSAPTDADAAVSSSSTTANTSSSSSQSTGSTSGNNSSTKKNLNRVLAFSNFRIGGAGIGGSSSSGNSSSSSSSSSISSLSTMAATQKKLGQSLNNAFALLLQHLDTCFVETVSHFLFDTELDRIQKAVVAAKQHAGVGGNGQKTNNNTTGLLAAAASAPFSNSASSAATNALLSQQQQRAELIAVARHMPHSLDGDRKATVKAIMQAGRFDVPAFIRSVSNILTKRRAAGGLQDGSSSGSSDTSGGVASVVVSIFGSGSSSSQSTRAHNSSVSNNNENDSSVGISLTSQNNGVGSGGGIVNNSSSSPTNNNNPATISIDDDSALVFMVHVVLQTSSRGKSTVFTSTPGGVASSYSLGSTSEILETMGDVAAKLIHNRAHPQALGLTAVLLNSTMSTLFGNVTVPMPVVHSSSSSSMSTFASSPTASATSKKSSSSSSEPSSSSSTHYHQKGAGTGGGALNPTSQKQQSISRAGSIIGAIKRSAGGGFDVRDPSMSWLSSCLSRLVILVADRSSHGLNVVEPSILYTVVDTVHNLGAIVWNDLREGATSASEKNNSNSAAELLAKLLNYFVKERLTQLLDSKVLNANGGLIGASITPNELQHNASMSSDPVEHMRNLTDAAIVHLAGSIIRLMPGSLSAVYAGKNNETGGGEQMMSSGGTGGNSAEGGGENSGDGVSYSPIRVQIIEQLVFHPNFFLRFSRQEMHGWKAIMRYISLDAAVYDAILNKLNISTINIITRSKDPDQLRGRVLKRLAFFMYASQHVQPISSLRARLPRLRTLLLESFKAFNKTADMENLRYCLLLWRVMLLRVPQAHRPKLAVFWSPIICELTAIFTRLVDYLHTHAAVTKPERALAIEALKTLDLVNLIAPDQFFPYKPLFFDDHDAALAGKTFEPLVNGVFSRCERHTLPRMRLVRTAVPATKHNRQPFSNTPGEATSRPILAVTDHDYATCEPVSLLAKALAIASSGIIDTEHFLIADDQHDTDDPNGGPRTSASSAADGNTFPVTGGLGAQDEFSPSVMMEYDVMGLSQSVNKNGTGAPNNNASSSVPQRSRADGSPIPQGAEAALLEGENAAAGTSPQQRQEGLLAGVVHRDDVYDLSYVEWLLDGDFILGRPTSTIEYDDRGGTGGIVDRATIGGSSSSISGSSPNVGGPPQIGTTTHSSMRGTSAQPPASSSISSSIANSSVNTSATYAASVSTTSHHHHHHQNHHQIPRRQQPQQQRPSPTPAGSTSSPSSNGGVGYHNDGATTTGTGDDRSDIITSKGSFQSR